MNIISGTIVGAFGLGLLGLAVVIAVKRPLAERFLHLFATSARAHYTEQVLRLVVGTAIVIFSPSMWYSYPFQVFGWLIVVTTIGLLLVPWQWHHRFAERVIPLAVRHLRIYGVAAFALGVFILYGASRYACQ
jgi:uncharacterized protein YjeT (DUF2065 family)